MRYKIVAKTGDLERTIYDTAVPLKSVALIDPKLHIAADSAGSFECTVPPDNICCKLMSDGSPFIQKMRTELTIWREDKNKKIWRGRVLYFDTDFNNMPTMYAEGSMSYFNDTIQYPRVYNSSTIPQQTGRFNTILADILNYHNALKGFDQIIIGNVSMPDELFTDTTFIVGRETTMATLKRLKSTYSGYFRVSYRPNDDRGFLDWFQSYNDDKNYEPQHIDFGKNLTDFTRKVDATSLANAIIPFGKTINSSGSVAIGENVEIISSDPNVDVLGPTAEGNYLSFGWGWKISPVGDTYDYIEEPSHCCTGFWDSGVAQDTYGTQDPDKAFRVYPGEVFYLSSLAVDYGCMYLISEGKLGHQGTTVRAVKKGPAPGKESSQIVFEKVTVPDPQYGGQLYLNMSALMKGSTTADPPITPRPVTNLNMSIYRGRVIGDGMDEKITLNGLDDGKPLQGGRNMNYYLNTKEHMLITPTPIDDGWYIYPRTLNIPSGNIMPREDFPVEGNHGEFYIDSNTGLIYLVMPQGSPDNWTYVLQTSWKAFKKEGLYLLDMESIQKYGRIEKIVEVSDFTEPSQLLNYSLYYIANIGTEKINIDVSALDLAILDNNVESPDVLDPIIVKSIPHGVNVMLPLQERDIPFNDLPSQTFSLGYEKNQRITDVFPYSTK